MLCFTQFFTAYQNCVEPMVNIVHECIGDKLTYQQVPVDTLNEVSKEFMLGEDIEKEKQKSSKLESSSSVLVINYDAL